MAGVHHTHDKVSDLRLVAATKLLDPQVAAAKGECGVKVRAARRGVRVLHDGR